VVFCLKFSLVMVIIGYAGSACAVGSGYMCGWRGGFGIARRGCGVGAGLENQTRAGMNFQLNVCYNKKGCSYNCVVPAWIAHALCQMYSFTFFPHIIADTEYYIIIIL